MNSDVLIHDGGLKFIVTLQSEPNYHEANDRVQFGHPSEEFFTSQALLIH